jgi:hypothetical protein
MAGLSAEEIFERYLWPLYPEDAKGDLARARATDANPGKNPTLTSHLDEAARVFEAMAGGLFESSDPRLDRTDASVHRLSAALTLERRDAWRARGAPGTGDNELFNVIVHAAAYVGASIVKQHGGEWSVRRPLWESVVRLSSRAGTAELAVLQWLVKSLADPTPGVPSVTLADRYRTHVEIPCLDPSSLPVLFHAPRDKPIPRLAKVRYHSLHQHLRAHAPEIRDVGEHFPSPERFDEMGFEWMDFAIVGAGRMLLLFGPGRGGAHLVWMSAAGFEKSAFLPADSFPAPILKLDGDKLVVLLSVSGQKVVQEMLWWGS